MDLIELIRDFIPELGSLDDDVLLKFDKLAYLLVKNCPAELIYKGSESATLLTDWFGFDELSVFSHFDKDKSFDTAKVIELGQELGSATSVELQRREWEEVQ